MPDAVRIPRWVRGLWGSALVLLNAFLLLYIAGFSLLVLSFISGSGAQVSVFRSLDEGSFALIFPVVAVAMFLSFALMTVSLVHIVLWSGLPDDRKLLWAVIVFAGAQPAMLAYWWLNVRQRPPAVAVSPAPDERPRRRGPLLLLGALTVVPVFYLMLFMLMVVIGIASSGTGGSAPEWAFALLAVAHISVIFLWWALTAIYLVDVFRTPRLDGWKRALWAVVIAMGGPIGWPVYWYVNMWRTPAAQAPVESPVER